MAIRDRALQPSPVSLATGVPADVSVVQASSGNVANAVAVATLASATGRTAYITGFQATASGASVALPVTLTVAGLAGGTASYTFTFTNGVLSTATPLIMNFPVPLAASGPGVDIVVTLPAGGSGNRRAAVSAQGFLV
ncbi:MAG: hypothetical protein L0Z50_40585 [Verrucomicrobiales bacterium]|nr:hypothetical protein [Verrucomicrobiales bacterium]